MKKMKNFEKLNTVRVLTEEEMQKFRGGATPCKNGCKTSCYSSCSDSCKGGGKEGVIMLPEIVIRG